MCTTNVIVIENEEAAKAAIDSALASSNHCVHITLHGLLYSMHSEHCLREPAELPEGRTLRVLFLHSLWEAACQLRASQDFEAKNSRDNQIVLQTNSELQDSARESGRSLLLEEVLRFNTCLGSRVQPGFPAELCSEEREACILGGIAPCGCPWGSCACATCCRYWCCCKPCT